MATATVLAGLILAANGTKSFTARINKTTVALSAQAETRFKVNAHVLPLCRHLNTNGPSGLSWGYNTISFNFSDDDMEVVAFFLAQSKRKGFLYIANSPRLGDRGAVALSEALKGNVGLNALELDGCSVGNAGTAALLEALELNKALHTVILNNICLRRRHDGELWKGAQVNTEWRRFSEHASATEKSCAETVTLESQHSATAVSSIQAFLDCSHCGETLCLEQESAAPIFLHGQPFRVKRSVKIRGVSARRPAFDCRNLSSFIVTESVAWIRISYLDLDNCSGSGAGGLVLRAEHVDVTQLRLANMVGLQAVPVSSSGTLMAGVTGGLLVEGQRVQLSHIRVSGSRSVGAGGAILILNATSVGVEHIVVKDTASSSHGGAIALLGSYISAPVNWRVGHVRIIGASAGGSGGGVAFVARASLQHATWSIEDVETQNTHSNGDGGAVALLVEHDMTDSVLSVQGINIRNTSAIGTGGGMYLRVMGNMVCSKWTVTSVAISRATSAKFGGAVAMESFAGVMRSTWKIEDAAFTETSCQKAGGAINLWVNETVIASRWLIRDIYVSNASSEDDGGGIVLKSDGSIAGNTWTVENVNGSNIDCGGSGGLVIFDSNNNVTNTSWYAGNVTVSHIAATQYAGAAYMTAGDSVIGGAWVLDGFTIQNVTAGIAAGGLDMYVNRHVHNATWIARNIVAAEVRSSQRYGGALCFKASRSVTNSRWKAHRFWVHNATSGGTGAGGTFRAAQADGLQLECKSWQVSEARAMSGGVWSIHLPSGSRGAAQEHTSVRLTDLHAVNVSTLQTGGVLSVLAERPASIRWRKRGDLCVSYCECDAFVEYGNASTLPLDYSIRLSAESWTIRTVVTQSGALAALTNTDATFSTVDFTHGSASSSGGIWELKGYSKIHASDVRATNIGSAHGVVLHQSDSPSNVTLVNVTVSPQIEQVSPLGHQVVLMAAGAIAKSKLSSVVVSCPVGYTVHNASRGRVIVSDTSFPQEQQGEIGFSFQCPVEIVLLTQAFPYFSSTIGCMKCAEGSYSLTPQSWSSLASTREDCGGHLGALASECDAPPSALPLPLFPNVTSQQANCNRCPVGAICKGGSHVVARLGHWGTTTPASRGKLIQAFPMLLFNYACHVRECQLRYDSCNGHRTGFACGRCSTGYGESFGSAACVARSVCDKQSQWVQWMAIPLFLCVIGGLFSMLSRISGNMEISATIRLLLTLLQSEALIRANIEDSMSLLAQIAQFQAALPALQVCLWPGMSARGKAAFPLLLGTMSIALILAIKLLSRMKEMWGRVEPEVHGTASRRVLMRALVFLLLASYGAITGVCLKVLARIHIEGTSYQALTGSPWLSTWDQYLAGVVLILVVIPTPVWTVYGLARMKAASMTDVRFAWGVFLPLPRCLYSFVGPQQRLSPRDIDNAAAMYARLAGSYREKCWFWEAIMQAQRLAYGLFALSLSHHLSHQAFAMVFLTAGLAVVHQQARPFSTSRLNFLHSAALASLAIVCASTVASAFLHENGEMDYNRSATVNAISSWATSSVAVLSASMILSSTVSKMRQRREKVKDNELPLLYPHGPVAA